MRYWILAGILVLVFAGCAEITGSDNGKKSSSGSDEAQGDETISGTWKGTINEETRGSGTLKASVTYNGYTYIGSWSAKFDAETVKGTLTGEFNDTEIWGFFLFDTDPGCFGADYEGQWAGNRVIGDFFTFFSCDVILDFDGTLDFIVE